MSSIYFEISDLMLKSTSKNLSYGEQLQLIKLIGKKTQARLILWNLTHQIELEKKLRIMESFDTNLGWQKLQKVIHSKDMIAGKPQPAHKSSRPKIESNGDLIVGIDNSFLSHSYNNGVLRFSIPDESPQETIDLSTCDIQFLMKLYMRLHAPENNCQVVHIKSAGLPHKRNNRRLECKDAIGFLLYFAKDLISVSLVNWENNDAPNTPGERMGPLPKLGKPNKKNQNPASCQPTGNQF